MKCQICGRSSLPGAKLCSDCRAARKRAFAATVTQPLLAAASKSGGRLLRPSQSVAATVRRAAEQSLFVKPPPAQESVRHPGINLIALLAPLAVMMVFGAYSAQRVAVNRAVDVSAVAAQASGGERQAAPSAIGVAPTLTALKPTAAEAVQTSETPPPLEPKADAKRVIKPRVIAATAPAPLLEKLSASTAVAPVMEAPSPPPPNPWQSMNESLAQCNGGLIDRVVCDLRVRQQYCNGYWGKVPQCPGGVANDHGQ
ncbi:MAG TPA: hypothetical protein VKG21_19275 [Casimicrobiaceae bacterium]|nr:hypothetical protein [Casimicrobiaceae bacterium]